MRFAPIAASLGGRRRQSQNQIEPNPAKSRQARSKKIKEKRISLDFLVRIKPFQGVAATPVAKKSFPVPFPRQGPLAIAALHSATRAWYHEF
jgi:hypothetical protein